MEFDDVTDQVRRWIGSEVVVITWLTRVGAAEGWLNDASGQLARIDEPYGTHQPVHYVRFESGHGFALDRTWFVSAGWNVAGGQRSLDVDLGAVTVSISAAEAA
jgi:hypothetical protein